MRLASSVLCVLCLTATGCTTLQPDPALCASNIPRELDMVSLPPYVIEPPDILLVDAVRTIPLPPYHIQPLDVLAIQVTGALAAEPISGLYTVDPDGTVALGLSYGTVRVVGLTTQDAKKAIEDQLKTVLKDFQVTVNLAQSQAVQQIRGEHFVRPDGTIGLGTYGTVRVVGLTLPEAKRAIEEQLSQYLQKPEISLDVYAYNSKVYYVIFDGGGAGQQIHILPVTGNDTVLRAIAQVTGLTPVSSKHHIWVARPGPACSTCDQVMAVDWVGITTRGRTETNYQLLPGDRIYVKADGMVELDTRVARIIQPFERIFGFILLGSGTIRDVNLSHHRPATGGTGF
jgi:polysaccharide export outer membrane protein